MPAAVPIALAVVAATSVAATGYQISQANQARRDAAEKSNAQQNAINDQIKAQATQDKADTKSKEDAGSATQSAALNALRASMSVDKSMGGTILTGGQGAAPAPTQTKTLLGI